MRLIRQPARVPSPVRERVWGSGMTKLVPEGYTLLSELRKRIVDENSGTALNVVSVKHARESLRSAGGTVSRLTGGYHVPPDAGTAAEGSINSAMERRDEMYHLADVRIRRALLGGALSPVTFRDDQTLQRIVDHDWRETDFNSGRIYVDHQHRRAHIYFKSTEVEKFLKLSKKGGKALTIEACKELLKLKFVDDPDRRMGKGEYYKFAHAELNIGTKWFKIAWDAVAPPERRQAGAKPKIKRA
jgi:hypothetical protein